VVWRGGKGTRSKRRRHAMASEGEEREARLREKREKRKRRREGCLGDAGEMDREEVEAPKGGRPWTVSIAVAGSIVENAQKFDLKTALAGQIARAATIFNVDEVVVYDDLYHASTGHSHASTFLARVLQYLEMPQYLRRALVPVHPDLKLCGTLPPLDAPHHPRAHEWKEYREGVVLPPRNQPDAPPGTLSKFVNVGLPQEVKVYPPLPSECRVTIHMGLERPKGAGGKEPLKGKAVAPEEPRTHRGTYWGYTTRLCQGISGVFQECPYEGGCVPCIADERPHASETTGFRG